MLVREVAFLGLCERDETFRTEKSDGWIHNIVALSPAILSPIFPLSLQGYSIVFAVYNIQGLQKARLRFLGDDDIPEAESRYVRLGFACLPMLDL